MITAQEATARYNKVREERIRLRREEAERAEAEEIRMLTEVQQTEAFKTFMDERVYPAIEAAADAEELYASVFIKEGEDPNLVYAAYLLLTTLGYDYVGTRGDTGVRLRVKVALG